MIEIVDNKFLVGIREGLDCRFIPSPNVNQGRQAQEGRTLIIHTTEGPSVQAAVGHFLRKKVESDPSSGLSIHLVLGRMGNELVQMVSFERGANHAAEFNTRSIGIELDYPGDLRETGKPKDAYRLRSNFTPDRYIRASALNDSHFRYWPLFERAQLDALVKVCKTLIDRYQITDVAGHEELHSYKKDPGPAFPIVQFRSQVGVKGRSIVLQETARDVRVRNMPGRDFVHLDEPLIPEGTPITVVNEFNDTTGEAFCLISAVETVQGDPWIVGWVRKEDVRVRPSQSFIVRDHYLETPDGRRFQEITPHVRGFDQKRRIANHKYIVMHFTTGTRVESTIAHFRNINSEVSAHLLIGRDGRVIQFLPFDAIAFHAGTSWWERDKSLNQFSIGIELDNAGILTQTPGGGWNRKGIPIADEDVVVRTHPRELRPRGWHTFSDVQLDVAEKIVRTLAEHYGGTEKIEMLGHDDVNLANRLDPGPAFPMAEMRDKIFGRPEPRFRVYHMDREASMYTNFEGHLPNVRQRLHDSRLPKGATVRVRREAGKWSLVDVVKAKGVKGGGWVLSNTLEAEKKAGRKGGGGRKGGEEKKRKGRQEEVRRVTKVVQDFYRRADSPPTPRLRLPKFDHDPRVRIEEVQRNWSLVVLLDFNGREGWVETRFLTPDPNLDPGPGGSG